jgi:hypothetical protein
LIQVKPMPGQAVYYKIKENNVFKYLDQAKKLDRTKPKNEMIPGRKTTTSNGLEVTIESNEEGKGLEPNKQVRAISFDDYKNLYMPKEFDDPYQQKICNDAITAIEYFITKHEKKFPPSNHPEAWPKKLKPGTWQDVIDTLFAVDEESYNRCLLELEVNEVIEFMDIYFDKNSYDKCDYSIVHFNNPKIKEILYYDWQRS